MTDFPVPPILLSRGLVTTSSTLVGAIDVPKPCSDKRGDQDPWGLVCKLAMGKARQTQVVAGLRVNGFATDDAADTARAVLRVIVPDDDPVRDTERHRALRAEAIEDYAGVDVPLFNR
uniref:Uncharacterized protein n=1 Tax=Timema douglasi TaxID=61478 RepID=A0A7R8VVC1_TIMDO|nr:unnamed protein product [Timema douglasi]